MFSRFLASFGIGAAVIDTVLEKSQYSPGELVRGAVRIRGGSVKQRIEAISLSVMSEYLKESDSSRMRVQGEIARFRVSSPFTLEADEQREVPFSFNLPYETPLTIGRAPVWIKTVLDIRGGMDPNDNDRIDVLPTPQMNTVLQALDLMGFRLRKAECEYARKLGRRVPFVQEFEFVPTAQFRGQLDELEVIFFGSEQSLELMLQIDRRARGLVSLFAELTDMDESLVRVRLSQEQLGQGPNAVARYLRDVIARYC